MSLSIQAKGLAGHGFANYQPFAGEPNITASRPTFFTSSQGFLVDSEVTSEAEFFESSRTYVAFVLNDTSPKGQIICVPDPMVTRSCGVAC